MSHLLVSRRAVRDGIDVPRRHVAGCVPRGVRARKRRDPRRVGALFQSEIVPTVHDRVRGVADPPHRHGLDNFAGIA